MDPGDGDAWAREIGDQRAIAERPRVAGQLRARVPHVGAYVGHDDRPKKRYPGQVPVSRWNRARGSRRDRRGLPEHAHDQEDRGETDQGDTEVRGHHWWRLRILD